MNSFKAFFRHFFEVAQHSLAEFSGRWDLHANRRTVMTLIISGLIIALTYMYVIEPPDSFPVGELVAVPQGEPLGKIAESLEERGVVRSSYALRALMKLMGDERSVHAGDYLFKEPKDLFSVARTLAIGAYGLEPTRVRVPEGATVKEMAKIFDRQFERFDADRFLSNDATKEGYLFPDTYFFLPNVTEEVVIQTLRQNFDEQISSLGAQVASSTHSLSDIVTMASIIEWEARDSTDRKMISGVLWNRIARGMPLQVDVTFLYTLGKGTFQLTNEDLMTPSPYNTYINKGLPPTPIGSPSLDSLLAAVQPTKNDYLYFLADRDGVTHYCKTYACQIANKKKYF